MKIKLGFYYTLHELKIGGGDLEGHQYVPPVLPRSYAYALPFPKYFSHIYLIIKI